MAVNYVGGNKDDITEAVHGLDIFTKNYCMNCKETEEKNEPIFMCFNGCPFLVENQKCLIITFAVDKKHNYPMNIFGCMGSL